jgi:predicted transcriptional regulator
MTQKQIPLRLDTTVISRLDGLAHRLGVSRNRIMERLLEEGINALEFEGVRRTVAEALPEKGIAELDAQLRSTEDVAAEHVEETIAEIAQDPTSDQVEKADPWGAVEKRHYHRFDALLPATVEYRNGVQFGFHECVCGAVEETKTKVRKQ